LKTSISLQVIKPCSITTARRRSGPLIATTQQDFMRKKNSKGSALSSVQQSYSS